MYIEKSASACDTNKKLISFAASCTIFLPSWLVTKGVFPINGLDSGTACGHQVSELIYDF